MVLLLFYEIKYHHLCGLDFLKGSLGVDSNIMSISILIDMNNKHIPLVISVLLLVIISLHGNRGDAFLSTVRFQFAASPHA